MIRRNVVGKTFFNAWAERKEKTRSSHRKPERASSNLRQSSFWRQQRHSRTGGRVNGMIGLTLSLTLILVAARVSFSNNDLRETFFAFSEKQDYEMIWLPTITKHAAPTEKQDTGGTAKPATQPTIDLLPSTIEADQIIESIVEETAKEEERAGYMSAWVRPIKSISPMAATAMATRPAASHPTEIRALQSPIFGSLQVDKSPVLRWVQMEYPYEAIKEQIEGRVIMTFIVETDGRAYRIEILRTPHPALAEAAIRGISRARFTPGKKNGHKVPAYMSLAVRFKIGYQQDRLGMPF